MCFWIVGTIAKKSGKLLLTVDLKSQRVSERTAGCVFLVKLPQILQKAVNGNDWMNMQPCSQKAHIKSAHIREIRKKRDWANVEDKHLKKLNRGKVIIFRKNFMDPLFVARFWVTIELNLDA